MKETDNKTGLKIFEELRLKHKELYILLAEKWFLPTFARCMFNYF